MILVIHVLGQKRGVHVMAEQRGSPLAQLLYTRVLSALALATQTLLRNLLPY